MKKVLLEIYIPFKGNKLGFSEFCEQKSLRLEAFARAFGIVWTELSYKYGGEYMDFDEMESDLKGRFDLHCKFSFEADLKTASRIQKSLVYFMLLHGFKKHEFVYL